jgi:DNA repair ATPase RecN
MGSLNFKYDFLDSFLDKKNTLVKYKNAYSSYSKSLERQKLIIQKVDVLNEKKDFLKFQLDELSNYDFQNWDEEAIQNDYKIAANRDEINDILEKINNIYSSNNGLRYLFGDLNSQSTDLKTHLKDFSSISDRIDSISIELEDVFHEINQNFTTLSPDKKNLQELDQQLRQINFLLKKFNVTDLKSLVLKSETFKKELSELSEMDLELSEINNLVESNKNLCMEIGYELFKLRSQKTSIIEKKINLKLTPTYCIVRKYFKGSTLSTHKDRDACEISLTYTISGPEWGIHMGDDTVMTKIGNGVIYKGCEMSHGRLKPSSGEVIQVFNHWVISDGTRSNCAYDGKNKKYYE